MIGHLRGTLLDRSPGLALIEAGGVGYEVTIPISTFTELPGIGGEAAVYVHTHVREDALALFGFATRDEKALFERLISISGVGPKLAITILSGLPVADLVPAIREGNLARLTRIPGVGKKTAERLVVELRDKLGAVAIPDRSAPAVSPTEDDVLSALLNLGCARPAAEAAVLKARSESSSQDFEFLFRRALDLVR